MEIKQKKDIRDILTEAQSKLEEQQAFIDKIMAAPLKLATVIELIDDQSHAIVAVGGQHFEVVYDADIHPLKVGDIIQLAGDGGIVGISRHKALGAAATVGLVSEGGLIQVEGIFGERIVAKGPKVPEVKAGDRVILDSTGEIIVDVLAKAAAKFNLNHATEVNWGDIGGLHHAKARIMEAVEEPHRFPELYGFFSKRPPKGVLLFGSPGGGKTLLGKAIATSIARIHGRQVAGSAFIYVKGPELLSKWVGDAEAMIRSLFAQGEDHYTAQGYPAILFIEEADAILSKRGTRSTNGMEKTMVPMFLGEMDGVHASHVIVILSTNRPTDLDPAVLRPGRIDIKINVGRPDLKTAQEILTIHLAPLPISRHCKIEDLVFRAVDRLYDPAVKLGQIQTRTRKHDLCFQHIVSGSMLAAVADGATQMAIRRNKAEALDPYDGINHHDVDGAVEDLIHQHRPMNHEDAAREVALLHEEEFVSLQAV